MKAVKLYPEPCADILLGDGSQVDICITFFEVHPKDELPLPSGVLFDIHRRFATALHLFSVEDKIARGWPRPSRGKVKLRHRVEANHSQVSGVPVSSDVHSAACGFPYQRLSAYDAIFSL